jgi:hypothetical protein
MTIGQQSIIPLRINNTEFLSSSYTISQVFYGADRRDEYSLKNGSFRGEFNKGKKNISFMDKVPGLESNPNPNPEVNQNNESNDDIDMNDEKLENNDPNDNEGGVSSRRGSMSPTKSQSLGTFVKGGKLLTPRVRVRVRVRCVNSRRGSIFPTKSQSLGAVVRGD